MNPIILPDPFPSTSYPQTLAQHSSGSSNIWAFPGLLRPIPQAKGFFPHFSFFPFVFGKLKVTLAGRSGGCSHWSLSMLISHPAGRGLPTLSRRLPTTEPPLICYTPPLSMPWGPWSPSLALLPVPITALSFRDTRGSRWAGQCFPCSQAGWRPRGGPGGGC